MAAKIPEIDIMEPKRVPKQMGLWQILSIMMLLEYKRFKECKIDIKVNVEGAFLQNLGKCMIDNLLYKNGFIWYTEVISYFFISR